MSGGCFVRIPEVVYEISTCQMQYDAAEENGSVRSMLHIPERELTLKTLKALNTLE